MRTKPDRGFKTISHAKEKQLNENTKRSHV